MHYQAVNPWTGELGPAFALATHTEVDRALTRASGAFRLWSSHTVEVRAAAIRTVQRKLEAHADILAETMTWEMGKRHTEAHAEIAKSAAACAFFADNAAAMLVSKPVATDANDALISYEPLGCILAIMPWNFPVWQVFRCAIPALMAGNVVLLKHAPGVPQVAGMLSSLFCDAGLPEGVFQNLYVDVDGVAQVIADPRCAGVALTGSVQAGSAVAAMAGRHIKKCVLELGGSDAFIVLRDADIGRAVEAAVQSRFGNAGQTCIAAKRFILEAGIADDFIERFCAAASVLKAGDPRLSSTTLAPMARADLRAALQVQVDQSIAAGAKVLLGCTPASEACVYPPSVLDHVQPGMPAYHEELFGPVASMLRVCSREDALRVANDTRFGLGASLWTRDAEAATVFARQLAVGSVFVNAPVRSDVRLPFGGVKASGFGRELGEVGLREFSNVKSVSLY